MKQFGLSDQQSSISFPALFPPFLQDHKTPPTTPAQAAHVASSGGWLGVGWAGESHVTMEGKKKDSQRRRAEITRRKPAPHSTSCRTMVPMVTIIQGFRGLRDDDLDLTMAFPHKGKSRKDTNPFLSVEDPQRPLSYANSKTLRREVEGMANLLAA